MTKKQTVLFFVKAIAQKLMPLFKDQLLRAQYAWWLLEHITKQSKAKLLTRSSIVLTHEQEKQLSDSIYELVHDKMPLQYILGSVSFCGLTITVKPPILIPRPETEEWVLHVIALLKKSGVTHMNILDMCTGSGCIALAFALAFPQAKIYAVDIEPCAIELAQYNAQQNSINNIIFVQSDVFAQLPTTILFDIIVSNPPYIGQTEWETLDPSVKKWEDIKALVANDNGYGIIQDIIATAPYFTQTNATLEQNAIAQLWIEVGHQQASTVACMMKKKGYSTVSTFTDMSNKERVVYGSVSRVANSKHQHESSDCTV